VSAVRSSSLSRSKLVGGYFGRAVESRANERNIGMSDEACIFDDVYRCVDAMDAVIVTANQDEDCAIIIIFKIPDGKESVNLSRVRRLVVALCIYICGVVSQPFALAPGQCRLAGLQGVRVLLNLMKFDRQPQR
jgi:hypothetical protein